MSHYDKALLMDGAPRDWSLEFARAMHHEIGDKLVYVARTGSWWFYSPSHASWAIIRSLKDTTVFRYITYELREGGKKRIAELEAQGGVSNEKLERARKRVMSLGDYAPMKRVANLTKEVFDKPDFLIDGKLEAYDVFRR